MFTYTILNGYPFYSFTHVLHHLPNNIPAPSLAPGSNWQGHICHALLSILEQDAIDGYCSRWPSGNWEPSDLLGMMG